MTYYNYLDEMQNICLRLSNAYKVTRDFDPLCADVYAKAEDGYFRAKENLKVSIASEPISEKLEQRLEILKQFVEKAETAAAYKLKEQSDAEKSQRTTA